MFRLKSQDGQDSFNWVRSAFQSFTDMVITMVASISSGFVISNRSFTSLSLYRLGGSLLEFFVELVSGPQVYEHFLRAIQFPVVVVREVAMILAEAAQVESAR